MIELTTQAGKSFFTSAQVIIGDKTYDMDDLTGEQKLYVSGKLEEQALGAAYSGRAIFKAEGLPGFAGCFDPH